MAWAAENGDRSENSDYIYGKRRLREIDRRIRFLSRRLESAEVVDPKRQKKLDQVFFGATVTYADGLRNAKTITVVGIDEADLSRGQVSWVSPLARALMKAHDGDIVEVRAPAGVEQIEVLKIRYAASAAKPNRLATFDHRSSPCGQKLCGERDSCKTRAAGAGTKIGLTQRRRIRI